MTRRERIALALVIGLALLLRIGYVLGQRSEVTFDRPQLDEARYVEEARQIVDGRPGEQDHLPYWQPPGVGYVLAATFRVAGPGLVAPRLLSAVVSAASCLLLFAIARRLFGVRAGIAGAAVLGLHGMVIFQAYELLPATFALALALSCVWLLLVATERGSPAIAAASGAALGASALFAATTLPFALAGVIALRRRRLAALAFVVGVALPIVPVTVRNYVRSGDLVMISSNAGLNFYLGNNADYRDTFALRPGRHWDELVREAERETGARGVTAAASSYFMNKGLAYVREDPLGAAGLLLRKGYLFFHGAEIARDSDIYAARASSVLLRVLVWPAPLHLPDGLLIPLALAGALVLWPKRRTLAVPLAFLGVQAIVVPLFFVSARHRVPAIPFFVLLAVGGAPELVRRVRALAPVRRAAAAVVFVALVVVLNWPTWETRLSLAGERELLRGNALAEAHDVAGAAAAHLRATELAPDDARGWFELGNSYDALGRERDAVDAWHRAAELDPWDSRARRREAVGRSRLGDVDGAIAAPEANIAAGLREPAHYAADHLNLAVTLARRGDDQRAIAHLRAAAIDPEYLRGALPRMGGALLGSGEVRSAAFFHALAEVARGVQLADLAAAAEARAAQL